MSIFSGGKYTMKLNMVREFAEIYEGSKIELNEKELDLLV